MMRRYGCLPPLALGGLLLLAGVVGAVPTQDPAPPPMPAPAPLPVTPPSVVVTAADYHAVVTLAGVDPALTNDDVVWDIAPVGATLKESKCELGGILVGAPGKYTVRAIGWNPPKDGKRKKFDERAVAEIRGPPQPQPDPKPDPGPQPKPDPKPDPAPAGEVSTFVVVEDTLKAGVWRGEILSSPAVEAFYHALQGARTGPVHKIVDVNNPAATPEVKDFAAKVPAGKKLPYLFLLDAAGKVVKEGEAPIASPADFVAFFDTHAGPRALGLIMAPPRLKWTEFGTTPDTPLIDHSQWPKVRKLTAFLPPVYDQDGVGQCASSSCCTVIEMAARVRGIPYPKLSAGDLYSRVNGGSDRGSLLEDNIFEAIQNGIAPASAVPYLWDGRRRTDAATTTARKKYRVAEAYWCKSFDAMVSASLQGFSVGTGLMWFNNFKPDAKGWLPKRGAGGGGGHALAVYGVEIREDGTVGVWTRNSWTGAWGFGGDCCIPETLFDGQIGGYYAVRVVTSPTVVSLNEKLNPFGGKAEFALAP